MKTAKVCERYCIGCGLCKSEIGTELKALPSGFLSPVMSEKKEEKEFLEKICPVNGPQNGISCGEIWGEYNGIYGAYSADDIIRRKASSGGVLTALATFLLDSGEVDGIIQVTSLEEDPTKTKCQVSTTKEEVLQCCGSRYSISSPWISLNDLVDSNKKYAAVGKPCDITALRNLKNQGEKYKNIIYLLSFFCAGLPSQQASDRLLATMNCQKENCTSLTYRGNGWPGYATATDKLNRQYTMEYSKAWGGILGRDVNPYCRICIDGIGESADISCGDGWYSLENGEPDFSEREGRNVVFVRTEAGSELYKKAIENGEIISEAWESLDNLAKIQKYQYTRRATMSAKLWAYRLFGKPVPGYDKTALKSYAKHASLKQKGKIFLGMVKRIVLKKI